MAQMVVAHHQEALFRQIGRELPVALDIFHHAVENLKDRFRSACLRPPFHPVELRPPVRGRVGKFPFYCHSVFLKKGASQSISRAHLHGDRFEIPLSSLCIFYFPASIFSAKS